MSNPIMDTLRHKEICESLLEHLWNENGRNETVVVSVGDLKKTERIQILRN